MAKSNLRLLSEFAALVAGAVLLTVTIGSISGDETASEPDVEEARASLKVPVEPDLSKVVVSGGTYSGYQPELAYQGFTLYPQVGGARLKLVNMSGNVVHQWRLDAPRARMLPGCSILVLHGSKWGLQVEPWSTLRRSLREYGWDGEVLWEYKSENPIHHDVHLLPNGNLLFLERVEVPEEITRARVRDPERRTYRFRSDAIVEITRKGKEVWRWLAHEHLDLNSCGRYDCEQEVRDVIASGKKQYDWSHANTVVPLPPNRWYESGDSRFRPGNLMIMIRDWSTVMIIDRLTNEVVWQYVGDYKGGLEYGHESHMIPPGLPGAGNVLIFDNGYERRESYILEINPVTKDPVWIFDHGPKFFSRVAGSVQRLPNGNTLISEDVPGRTFEVTSKGEIVWQYSGTGRRSARAHRYAPDYCPKFAGLPLHTEG